MVMIEILNDYWMERDDGFLELKTITFNSLLAHFRAHYDYVYSVALPASPYGICGRSL